MPIFDYDGINAAYATKAAAKAALNNFYGKLGDPYFPEMPRGTAYFYSDECRLAWEPPQPRIPVPALDVPKPAPTMQPGPESPSVQLLRGLLADRRKTIEAATAAQKSRDAQIAEAQKRIDDLTARNADDQRTIDAGRAAEAQILADIEKLGGAPEAVAE